VDSMAHDAGFVRLTALPNDTLILHGDNGDLLVSRRQDALSIPDVNGYRADTGLLRLLVWQDGRVGVVDLAGGATAGGNAESSLRVDWVATQGARVEQAFFVLEGTHVLYRESRRVFLVGPDREGERKTVPVSEVLPGTSVFYSDEDGALYFIDALTRRPSRLAMVERTQTVERLLLDLRARVPR
jgi:hypothetical protein